MKEIKDNINRWRDSSYYWVERNNIMKMTILPISIYRLNAIPIKLSMAFFTELEQTNKNSIHMETQKTPNSQRTLEKEEWSWRNKSSDFRLYYKGTVIKTVWSWPKKTEI